ncbi:MAG: STAS domain-containing protein, partial [Burkholderiaceae bacterium]
ERSYAATRLAPMHGDAGSDHSDFMPTQTISSFGRDAGPTLPPTAALMKRAETMVVPAFARAAGAAGFSDSRTLAVELVEGMTDPDLEEASIRFANGDNAGAEEGLLTALSGRNVRRELAESWTAALFDLYRATGQQARFDAVAIDYAERFGKSAPSWFSMSDVLGIPSATSLVRTMPSQLMDEPIWSSPCAFNQAAADTLRLAIANAASPWFLDWSAIETIEPDTIEALGAVFEEWTTSAVQLRFRGSASLERALRACTPSGVKAIGHAPWRLRMNALRVMQLQDEFDLVALDYCVSFEVSPPAWHDALCHFHRQFEGTERGESAFDVREEKEDAEDLHPMTVPMGFEEVPATVVELSGEILGEATDALARLEQAREGGARLVVSCANLIRVDFSAAGSILNWVALRQAEGCHLQFRDVHRLVAAFFNVIGINEHARVVLRSN